MNPDRHGQVVEVDGADSPSSIANAVASRVKRLVLDPTVSAAAIVLPNVTALDVLAGFAVHLRAIAPWSVLTTKIQPPQGPQVVACSISCGIPFEDETRPSEALVLGPFGDFPPTRRAPVTALEIFVGAPLPNDPKTNQPTTKANLSHIRVPLQQKAFQSAWEKSTSDRLMSLGVEDPRAKARVSFVVPLSVAQSVVGFEP